MTVLSETILQLLNDCPFGHHQGRVNHHRGTTEADMIAWIDRLHVVKDELRAIEKAQTGPTLGGEDLSPDPTVRREQIRAVVMGEPQPQLFTKDGNKELWAKMPDGSVRRVDMSASALTDDELRIALANVGVDITCGACAEMFYTGHYNAKHTHPILYTDQLRDQIDRLQRMLDTGEQLRAARPTHEDLKALVRTADITSQASMNLADALSHACSELLVAQTARDTLFMQHEDLRLSREDVCRALERRSTEVAQLRAELHRANSDLGIEKNKASIAASAQKIVDALDASSVGPGKLLTEAWKKGVLDSIDKLYAAAVSGIDSSISPHSITITVARVVELLNIMMQHPPEMS